MFGSFFQYLSWFGYLCIGLGLVSIAVLLVSLVRLRGADVPAKPEKALRHVGFCVVMVTLVVFIVFVDWAFSHGYVIKDGKPVVNISESSAMVLFYVAMSLTIAWISLLGATWLTRRRREDRATDEHTKMYMTLHEEYGPEEATRLMERAGHRKKWLDSFKN